jgi:hypothetical protein
MKKSSLMCVALLLSACGGGGSGTMVTPAPPAPAPTPATEAFFVRVMEVAGLAPEDTEAADVSAVNASAPEDTEPLGV